MEKQQMMKMSKYNTNHNATEEMHPQWKNNIPANVTALILGTYPTHENNYKGNPISIDFYYPNPNNDFWTTLAQTAGESAEAYKLRDSLAARLKMLKDLKLGVADMGLRVLRNGESSLDKSLFPIEYTDIFSILDEHQTIRKIILTSSSGSNSVLAWFTSYCELNGVKFKIKTTGEWPRYISLEHNGREITVALVSSTSRVSPIRGEELIDMYKAALAY
jgi:G:T/U-mismatch repair DNA glycosylase